MQISGNLIGNQIIVKKLKDVGRLYNKSHFGKSIPVNRLQLDLIEGVFLLGEGKIRIFYNKKEMSFQELVKIAAKQVPEFEIKYLIFKDLRNRGLAIKLCDEKENTDFFQFKQKREKNAKQCFISVFSERDILDLKETKNLIKEVIKKNGELWFGIVDEEGDITYYNVTSLDLSGNINEYAFPKGRGILLKNRVVLFDKKLTNGFKIIPEGSSFQITFTDNDFIEFFKPFLREKTEEILFTKK